MNQIQLQNLIIFSTNESMLQNPKNRFHWCLKQTIHHHPTIKSGQSQQQKPKIKPQKRRKKSKIQQEHTWSGKIKRIRIWDQWYPFLRSRAPVHPHGERRGAIVAVLRRASPRHRSINRCASLLFDLDQWSNDRGIGRRCRERSESNWEFASVGEVSKALFLSLNLSLSRICCLDKNSYNVVSDDLHRSI